MTRHLATALVILATTSVSALAQVAGNNSPVCNSEFAHLLVQQQVGESKSVTDSVKRIKILLRAGDFLWKLDEPTARSYFGEAWKMADDRFKEKGFEKKEPDGKKDGLIVNLPDQRTEVIRTIAKKDSEWARKLSDQMLADFEKAKERNPADKTRELSDLLSVAQQSAKTNPEFSRQIFRRVMKYPLFTSWFWSLYGTYSSNPELANSIYSEALVNFRNEVPSQLLLLSAYPFAQPRIFGPEKNQHGTSLPSGLSPNPNLQRQFLDTFFARIASYAASVDDINREPEKNRFAEPIFMSVALSDLEPIVLDQLPDLLQQFSVARSQAESLLNENQRKQADESRKTKSLAASTFEESLAEVEKADNEGKLTDSMLVNLTVWVKKTDDQFEQAKTWLDKIIDEKVRSETTNYYWFQRSKLAISEKRFEEADRYALKVPEIEHRAVLLFEIANLQVKNERDVGGVFETLNRISKLTKTADNSVIKAQIQLGLANVYERVNHSVALDELTEAIRVTNSLKDPDIFTTSVTRQIVGKGFGFFASFETTGYDLEKTFGELSKKDFQSSLAQAKFFDDKYFRTLAVIAIANNCTINIKPAAKPKPKPSAQQSN